MCADRAWQDAFGGRCFAGCVGVERTLPGCPVPNLFFGLFFGSLKIISSIHSQVTKVFCSWGFMDSMVSWY